MKEIYKLKLTLLTSFIRKTIGNNFILCIRNNDITLVIAGDRHIPDEFNDTLHSSVEAINAAHDKYCSNDNLVIHKLLNLLSDEDKSN